jgi:hypothetical protein
MKTKTKWIRLRDLASAAGLGAMMLVLPCPARAQQSVPLLVIPSSADGGDDGGSDATALIKSMHSNSSRPGAGLIYVNPSEITYPLVLQGMTIAAPTGPDVQVNDPSLDNIQYPVASDPYPWEFATESESTLATDGTNIVVSYNSSAGSQIVKFIGNQQSGHGLFTQWFVSAYSVSHDGGQTWRSGFISPSQSSIATWGDGVVAIDRVGNFYYASCGQDAAGNSSVIVGKSTDHGDTFGTAQTVAVDGGRDKEWLAVGPDPGTPSRDNLYVTWSSYANGGSTLMFSRSTDGGATWSPAKTIFAYTNDGVLSSSIQGSTPTVDKSNGKLYVAFLQFGVGGLFRVEDYIRTLASDDGGNTFYSLAFNIPGAPSPFVYPKVSAGISADQGDGASGLGVIKQGPDIGGGNLSVVYGLPRYVNCSRIMGQPAAAAQNNRLVVTFEASTSPTYGNPSSQSQVISLYSKDGGATWFPPFIVAQATPNDPQHVLPAVALTHNANTLYVGYYVQDSNEQLRTELATLQVTGGGLLLAGRKSLSSVRFDLEPNNIPSPLSPLKSLDTINFDRSKVQGYALGEYMGVAIDANGNPMAAWGDCRNTWVSPANGFYPGAHPQTDVFFVRP